MRAPLLHAAISGSPGYPASKRTAAFPDAAQPAPAPPAQKPAVRRVDLPLAQPQVQDVARLRSDDTRAAVPRSTGRLSMSMTRFGGPSPSAAKLAQPRFADHAATRRSVGCEGCPPLPSGAVPARSLVASRSAGSSRSASLCSRRPCPASSRSVREPLLNAGSGARPACPAAASPEASDASIIFTPRNRCASAASPREVLRSWVESGDGRRRPLLYAGARIDAQTIPTGSRKRLDRVNPETDSPRTDVETRRFGGPPRREHLDVGCSGGASRRLLWHTRPCILSAVSGVAACAVPAAVPILQEGNTCK